MDWQSGWCAECFWVWERVNLKSISIHKPWDNYLSQCCFEWSTFELSSPYPGECNCKYIDFLLLKKNYGAEKISILKWLPFLHKIDQLPTNLSNVGSFYHPTNRQHRMAQNHISYSPLTWGDDWYSKNGEVVLVITRSCAQSIYITDFSFSLGAWGTIGSGFYIIITFYSYIS